MNWKRSKLRLEVRKSYVEMTEIKQHNRAWRRRENKDKLNIVMNDCDVCVRYNIYVYMYIYTYHIYIYVYRWGESI